MKPSAKARQGKQGLKRATPGQVNAKGKRRRAATGRQGARKANRRAAIEPGPPIAERMPRRLRMERVHKEALKARARPPRLVGSYHELTRGMRRLFDWICEHFDVSPHALSEICHIPWATLHDAMAKEHCDNLHFLGMISDGFAIPDEELFRRLVQLGSEARTTR